MIDSLPSPTIGELKSSGVFLRLLSFMKEGRLSKEESESVLANPLSFALGRRRVTANLW
jgi:hypothetical protein